MTDKAAVARAFLSSLEARDWDAWEALMTPEVVYEMPQTRERIRGRAGYRQFNVTYPGEWHLTPKVVIGDADRAVAWFTWTLDDDSGSDSGDAQAFFEFDADGLITQVTDFWPESYDPPPRKDGPLEPW